MSEVVSDPPLLAWAATADRILVTSDVQTMIGFAYERLKTGDYTPGVIVVPQSMPIGQAIDELVTIIACSAANEWENQVTHLPLK